MSEWLSYHLYYGDIDTLILECVNPFLERSRPRLERCFWERHFAGGPHLRVRLRGSPAETRVLGDELAREAGRFITDRPSADLVTYSEANAAALMRKEGEEPDPAALRYRNNVVEEHGYQPPRHVFASDDALALAEDFRHDSMPLAARVLASQRPKNEHLLRLFFLQALDVCRGDLPGGCVSCKSHWEGFAASFPSPQVVERIRANQHRNRDAILTTMHEVTERYEQGTLDQDPVLAGWSELLERYRTRTRADLAAGKQITDQPETPEEARQVREKMFAHFHTDNAFARTFWADDRFIASFGAESRWMVPRVLTNLLYQFVATVGIGPIDRMALCYFAFRTVEEHYACDLGEILEANIAQTVAANSDRWVRA
jgi:Lantibiotic biosynthesis dehydratase C-term